LKYFGKVELIKVVRETDFYRRHGQHLNSRGKVSVASKTARTVDSMIKKKVDHIRVKWFNDVVTDRQKC